jgi:hypothetical protein
MLLTKMTQISADEGLKGFRLVRAYLLSNGENFTQRSQIYGELMSGNRSGARLEINIWRSSGFFFFSRKDRQGAK